jgi:hypothetical protein
MSRPARIPAATLRYDKRRQAFRMMPTDVVSPRRGRRLGWPLIYPYQKPAFTEGLRDST